jgi:hypothetical protein
MAQAPWQTAAGTDQINIPADRINAISRENKANIELLVQEVS